MDDYWLQVLIRFLFFFSLAYVLGLWVKKKHIKVNYTRKIFQFTLTVFSINLARQIPFDASLYTAVLRPVLLLATVALMMKPIRDRSSFISTAFLSIDRPEDRPFTLVWFSTQVVATYCAIIAMVVLLSLYEKQTLIYITAICAGIGDGLAEPVGVRFGKHKYKTRALFTDKKYTRSIEGSLCVFVSGIFAILLMSGQLTSTEVLVGLLIIPIVMTLAEAFSPHTWDGPFLYLAGGLSTVLVLEASSFLQNV